MKIIKKILCTTLILAVLVTAAIGASAASEADESFLIDPTGIYVTDDGLLVTDAGRNAVIKVTEEGASVYAGYTLPVTVGATNGGHLDGRADQALFNKPTTAIMWNDGLLISDTENHCLRWMHEGLVRTLAGCDEGEKDGWASRARFSRPMGLVNKDDQYIYVADSGNGLIRCIDLNGNVSTYLTSFDAPCGLVLEDGVFYITDMGANLIYSYNVKRDEVKLIGGFKDDFGDSAAGYKDGKAEEALFDSPTGIVVDKDGTVYVADTGNSAIRVIRDGEVSTLLRGSGDGTYPVLVKPTGLALKDELLYICDSFTGSVFAYELD